MTLYGVFPYDLLLDRISHEVPFYRTWLKHAVVQGATRPDPEAGYRVRRVAPGRCAPAGQ